MGARTVRAECDYIRRGKTPKVPKRHRHAHGALCRLSARHRRYGRSRLLPARSLKCLSPCRLRAADDMLATSLKRLTPPAPCFIALFLLGAGGEGLLPPGHGHGGSAKNFIFFTKFIMYNVLHDMAHAPPRTAQTSGD